MTRGIDVSIAGHIHTLGVQHMCLPKTDLLRLALLAPRRLRDIADTDNAHGWWVWSVDNWIEHDHRNRKLRRQHVELLRLADIDGVLTRVVADAHASAHTQQFGNRHMIRSCGEQSSASRCCRISLGLAGRVQARDASAPLSSSRPHHLAADDLDDIQKVLDGGGRCHGETRNVLDFPDLAVGWHLLNPYETKL